MSIRIIIRRAASRTGGRHSGVRPGRPGARLGIDSGAAGQAQPRDPQRARTHRTISPPGFAPAADPIPARAVSPTARAPLTPSLAVPARADGEAAWTAVVHAHRRKHPRHGSRIRAVREAVPARRAASSIRTQGVYRTRQVALARLLRSPTARRIAEVSGPSTSARRITPSYPKTRSPCEEPARRGAVEQRVPPLAGGCGSRWRSFRLGSDDIPTIFIPRQRRADAGSRGLLQRRPTSSSTSPPCSCPPHGSRRRSGPDPVPARLATRGTP